MGKDIDFGEKMVAPQDHFYDKIPPRKSSTIQ
jgi:hypothetical protein